MSLNGVGDDGSSVDGSGVALGENPGVVHSPQDDDPYTFSGKVCGLGCVGG